MSVVLLGSTSGSVTLQEPAVAGSTTINLPATSGTMAVLPTATSVLPEASGGTGTTTGYYGFKNRIINGAMVIDQRNAGASVTPTTSGTYTLDRWAAYLSQSSKYSVRQNAGSVANGGSVVAPTGFTNWLGATSLSAYSVGSSEFFSLLHIIEGFNASDFGWGAAGAATVTLSFWVRSSLTGTFGGAVQSYAGDANYPFSYTISAANTWEQKTVTIAGPTTGTFPTNNTASIAVGFCLGAGATLSGTAGSWSSTLYRSATGATSVVGTNGATFYITGVQLEKGSTATSFDYRPYGTELALCQRYFQSYTDALLISRGTGYNTTAGITQSFSFPVQMRIAPAATVLNGSNAGAPSALTIPNIGVGACTFAVNPTSAATSMYYQWNMTLSSEL